MGRIIRDLIKGKMNVRQFILWLFAVCIMMQIAIGTGYIVWAVMAVAEYSVEHPEEWVKR